MAAININNNNFHNEVMSSEKKVLLDFWAPWCGPCRMVVPMVEEIAKERPDIKVGKINVDENPELAKQFGVLSHFFFKIFNKFFLRLLISFLSFLN